MTKQVKATLFAVAGAAMLAIGFTACNKKPEPITPTPAPAESVKPAAATPAAEAAPAAAGKPAAEKPAR
jgi:hypothetical protein